MQPISVPDDPFPYADTVAVSMMQVGIRRASEERGLSLRSIAKRLEYKQATVLSHMAKGRIPVPLERATDIAIALDLPPDEFFQAVVAQRNPAAMMLLRPASQSSGSVDGRLNFVAQLTELAQTQLDRLSDEQKHVIREVVLDPHAGRRWLAPAELPIILLLRRLRPGIESTGLRSHDLAAIEKALSSPT